MVTQNLAILSQKENKPQKISTTVDNTINLKPDKKTKYLKKTQGKTTSQGWGNKARKYGKSCKNLFDEDQTAFEAVTFEGRNFTKLQKYVPTNGLPPTLFWDEKTAYNDRDIGNSFNQYFQSVFNKPNEKPCMLNQTNISVLQSIYFTEEEIKITMVNLKLT